MSGKQESDTEDSNVNQNLDDDQNHSRRKFIKGAAAVTPVILSVASRPVWARNCSLSGQLSGNLSDHDGIPCNGEGCTIGFWAQKGYRSNSYHPKFPAHMLFYDAFGIDAFPGKTLYDVVSKKYNDNEMKIPATCDSSVSILPVKGKNLCANMLRELGAQAVAALQNSASPMKYDLDVETVILSFQRSYENGTAQAMEDTKTAFDKFNNQYCPLPYGI